MSVTLETVSDEQDAPIRIVLPFKDQKSANAARHQLGDLSRKIDAVVHPVYTSQKIKGQFKPKEHKPSIVNQQNWSAGRGRAYILGFPFCYSMIFEPA